ncbi:acyl transferase-like protein [Strigomonas culicis]|uniref:[acyl-carrier-protein] S-malonyltransferase n=1 Tax=Strigomonas culicis TaxID=28005 RepID=S9V6I3_9TRYP|nr:acyl transferase-like protein [Strigomonas culicis]|eukprot:EPY18525.1 acyl transferase-like protein [Strigomonas culicis]
MCSLGAYDCLRDLKKRGNLLNEVKYIAGHSLGEFSALCALNVFSPETALNLVYKRGVLMEETLRLFYRSQYRMYACNPLRSKLDGDADAADDMFFVLIELIARCLSHTTSFLEVSNFNLEHEQYVVSGDQIALSILGKCLDPQFRANSACSSLDNLVRSAAHAVKVDGKEGITLFPNALKDADFVTSAVRRYGSRSAFRRFMRGPDDGFTPSLDELTHLTLQEDGRSGLKKKSWFIPLPVEVPFHTSKLRMAGDLFVPVVREALPEETQLRDLLSISANGDLMDQPNKPLWVTNLTGTLFNPLNDEFVKTAKEAIASLNIGEVQHKGRYNSSLIFDTLENGVKQKSVKEICCAVLAAQMSHSVMWTDVMNEIVLAHNCTEIHEIAPVRNVSEMFKRSSFHDKKYNNKIPLKISCFPADINLY